MMQTTTNVKGVYRFGKVEFLEPVQLPENTEVSVQVPVAVAPPEKPPGRMMTLGMFPELKGITEEDFKAAEWHGEPEFWGEAEDDARP
jgi:hypothetical protein